MRQERRSIDCFAIAGWRAEQAAQLAIRPMGRRDRFVAAGHDQCQPFGIVAARLHPERFGLDSARRGAFGAASIDLENLASFGMEELSDLRAELERLNSLAQLGIAVEIVGHELQSYDEIIGAGLRRLPEDVRQSKAAKDIEFGYDGLTDQLRFLSPLRLAGQRVQRWITGAEIAQYVREFFKINLGRSNIDLTATPAFEAVRVYDQQSRLYPVFLNLINNSVYWLSVSDRSDRRILLDRAGDEIVVSDNGPGIDAEDLESLFSLFFTKKARGGRGVGLYLSRANLAAGGHKIRYEPDTSKTPLSGANFYIAFRGAE